MERAGHGGRARSCSSASRAASRSSAAAATTAATAASARACCASAGRDVTVVEGFGDLGEPDVIVDALLGIGLKEAPREDVARMIERINASGKPVVAVDVPSGVDASTGEVPGAAVRADGHRHVRRGEGRARDRARALPRRARCRSRRSGSRPPSTSTRSCRRPCSREVPRKARASTKYRAGSGARRRRLARADRRADARGARRVPRRRRLRRRVAAPESTLPVIESRAARGGQAAAARGLGRPAARRARPTRCSRPPSAPTRSRSGPGLGRSDGTRELVRVLLERLELPVVLDADALWELEPFARAAPTVLTPHAASSRALLGATADGGRRAPARTRCGARRRVYGAVVLLKGADTLVAAPREGVLVAGVRAAVARDRRHAATCSPA